MPRGKFITFEGGEGCGKSTHTKRLAQVLEAIGIKTLITREPGGTPAAEAIRELLLSGRAAGDGLSETLLMLAARADHVMQVIEPALEQGTFVICDRFMDSTMAYQGYGRGVDKQKITDLHKAAFGALKPDLTFVMDLAPETGLARAAKRRGTAAVDAFEDRELAFHTALREGFLAIAKAEPGRCVVMDGTLPKMQMHQAIVGHTALRLKLELTPLAEV